MHEIYKYNITRRPLLLFIVLFYQRVSLTHRLLILIFWKSTVVCLRFGWLPLPDGYSKVEGLIRKVVWKMKRVYGQTDGQYFPVTLSHFATSCKNV
jgi:hypothetical protein